MPKTIALIPARCGSQSIKMKNVKLFCGKPLIYWNLNALEQAAHVDEVVVATDCDEIAKTVLELGFSKVSIYRRLEENASSTASTESVMLEFIEKKKVALDSLFILVQCTSPFTKAEDFDTALVNYQKDPADSLLTCASIKRFFWNKDGTPANYDYRNRPRRQDFDGTLLENGAFYINTVENIVKDKNRLSGKIMVHVMPEYTALELDEPDDWMIGEKLMRKHFLPTPSRKAIKLFVSDVDGVLTDAGMYYSQNGDELKKFNTHDGKGFELLRNLGVKTAIITSEDTQIVARRAAKLKVDYLYQGIKEKLGVLNDICQKEGIGLDEVAYIGDDINDLEPLSNVGLAACPSNSRPRVKEIPNIIQLDVAGGSGAVRTFVELILERYL
jgi:N-acylneuraminate cytidylyltransferase